MGVFEDNINVISTSESNRLIKEFMEKGSGVEKKQEIEVEATKVGTLTTYINENGQKRYLASRYNPENEAVNWTKRFEFKADNSVLAVFGFGIGNFIRELLKILELEQIIVYEPDVEIFYHTMKNYELTDVLSSPKVNLIVSGINEWMLPRVLLCSFSFENIKMIQTATLQSYKQKYATEEKNFLEHIVKAQKDVKIGLNTMEMYGFMHLQNVLKNMNYLKESSTGHEMLQLIEPGVPVIAVMAGPSVEEELEDLRAAKGKFPILAVDRIVNFLMENGIEPDMMFTIDPVIDETLFDIEKVSHIPIVGSLVSGSGLLELHKGKKGFISIGPFPGNMYIKLKKYNPMYQSGNTVAGLMMGVLLGERIQEIYLVGQDLAFHGDVTHAGDVKEKVSYFDESIWVEGINGEKVRSRTDWEVMLRWYQGILNIYSGTQVYDTKNEGAKISGTSRKKIKDALVEKNWEKKDYRQMFCDCAPTFNEEEWSEMIEYFEKVEESFQKIKEMLPEAIEASEKLIEKKLSKIKKKEYSEIVLETNRYISTNSLAAMIDEILTGGMRAELVTLSEKAVNQKEDEKKVLMVANKMFRGIEKVIEALEPLYSEMLEKIR